MVTYPNLTELYRFHPYSESTFANYANVTIDLFLAVLRGEEELRSTELSGISNLTGVPIGVLVCPHKIMLDSRRWRHRMMVEKALSEAEKVKEYMRYGKTDYYTNAANFSDAFRAGTASYAQYLGLLKDIQAAQVRKANEQRGDKLRGRRTAV